MTRVHEPTVGLYYGLVAFFIAIIHNVFLLYHVETFVSVYKIDKLSFWVGEIIFLVWNSCNDPLFGWMSDKQYLFKATDSSEVIAKRVGALAWNGPFLAISFLAIWVSWSFPIVQFIVCLCLYDGFLTMMDLHHSALLADLAVSNEERTRLNFYCSSFSAVGSVSVFLSYLTWNRDDLFTFQMFCFGLSLFAVVGFMFSTTKLKQSFSYVTAVKEKKEVGASQVRKNCTTTKDLISVSEKKALKKFIKDLTSHRNFMCFAAMNLLQVFHCHFNSNFFPLFLESLLGDSISQTSCSLILGVSFIAPHLNNLYFLSLCRKWGVYRVIQLLFSIKLALTLLMLYVGPTNIPMLVIFIASNRVFTEGTCKLLTLVISDLVDEDYVIHHRQQAVSALMFGTSAFLSKPGQTLAPLLGTWLLATYTGHDVFHTGHTEDSLKLDLSSLDAASLAEYRSGVFSFLVYVPAVVALLQLVVWAKFTLHGKRLNWVKEVRRGAVYGMV